MSDLFIKHVYEGQCIYHPPQQPAKYPTTIFQPSSKHWELTDEVWGIVCDVEV